MSNVKAVNRDNSSSGVQKVNVLSPSLKQRIATALLRVWIAIKNFGTYLLCCLSCRGPKQLTFIELETLGKDDHRVKMKKIASDIRADSPFQQLQRKADERRVELILAGQDSSSIPSILSLEKIEEARFKIEQLKDHRDLAALSDLSSPALFGLFEKFVPAEERNQIYQSLGTPSFEDKLGQIWKPKKRSDEASVQIGKERALEKNGRFYREALMDLLIDRMDRFGELEAKLFLGKVSDAAQPTEAERAAHREQIRDYILICVLKELEGERLQPERDFTAPHHLHGDEIKNLIEKERILSPEKDKQFYKNKQARLNWYIEMFNKYISQGEQSRLYSSLGQPRWYERFSVFAESPTPGMIQDYIQKGKEIARENRQHPEALTVMTDLVIQQLDKQIRELRIANGI